MTDPDRKSTEGLKSLNEAIPTGAGTGAGTAGGGSSSAGTGSGGSPAGIEDYSLGSTRKKIAFFLLFILAGVIALVAVVSLIYSANCWFDGKKCKQAEDALTLLNSGISPMFTAMVGLVGSVVGFYFGSRETT